MSTLPPPWEISADAHEKVARGHSNESLPINAVGSTAERSFSKLRLNKMFHRSSVTNEKLRNLAMIYSESETAKTSDELAKIFTFLKACKKSFS